ncbi:MAG TPA: cation:proton antiporter [Actinomycetes bacterium]|nr:cation:proton antiporter [Actinomycetes bacterium]
MELARGLETLLVAATIAALAPMVVALLPGPRVPQVVVLLLGGVLVGPELLGWADREAIDLLANVGLGFLFLMAGYELDPRLFRERPGRLAIVAWLVTVAIAAAIVGVLAATGFVRAYVPVALGLTTTALGTLLPILRDNDMLGGRFGRYLMAAGAVGELFPILAIAVFLGTRNQFVALASLAAVGVLAVVLSFAPRLVRGNRLGRILREGEGSTAQTYVRWAMVLLLLLLVIAQKFGLDVVLGAFLAGVVLHRWAPGDVHALESKLDAIGYGFFIPLFFVASGMTLDIRSIAAAPLRLLIFFVLLLVVRGVPALFLDRRDLAPAQRVEMMFLTATALPLLVALAEIGLRNGTMLRENAAALVGAGVLSVLVFPMVAVMVQRRARAQGRITL